jgi:hypothetical protein
MESGDLMSKFMCPSQRKRIWIHSFDSLPAHTASRKIYAKLKFSAAWRQNTSMDEKVRVQRLWIINQVMDKVY